MTPLPGPTTQDSGHTTLLDIGYMQTFNLLHRGQNILDLTNNADAIFPLYVSTPLPSQRGLAGRLRGVQ